MHIHLKYQGPKYFLCPACCAEFLMCDKTKTLLHKTSVCAGILQDSRQNSSRTKEHTGIICSCKVRRRKYTEKISFSSTLSRTTSHERFLPFFLLFWITSRSYSQSETASVHLVVQYLCSSCASNVRFTLCSHSSSTSK